MCLTVSTDLLVKELVVSDEPHNHPEGKMAVSTSSSHLSTTTAEIEEGREGGVSQHYSNKN